MAAERAWKLTRSAFEFFTPEGRFNDRQQAQAVVAAALRHLSGPAWAKTRRLLLRRESFTFLDQAQRRLAELGLDPDVLSALLDLEGLQRQAWRLSESTPGSAATRAWALARTVQLAKAEPHWQELYAFRQFHAPLEIYGELQTVLIVSMSSRTAHRLLTASSCNAS